MKPSFYTEFTESLNGIITVPGDKSISHRSLIIASQAMGVSRITGLLEGEDVLSTLHALQMLGVIIKRDSNNNDWLVNGSGIGALTEPTDILNLNNSGTGVRLLMGLVSSYNFTTFFSGDKSLRSRPMNRVCLPLLQNGSSFITREGGKLPLVVKGNKNPIPIDYRLPVASAQVKSAILLSALNIAGTSSVIESEATRDHTELMLQSFGAKIIKSTLDDGAIKIEIEGQPDLQASNIVVPADPSSAAFLIVAALITPDSCITVQNVCLNPLRTGLFTTLQEMGANITISNKNYIGGELVADITAKTSKLNSVTVPKERAPSMIDEFPILAVAASVAKGQTIMKGLAELKVKESNRLNAIAENLVKCGIKTTIIGDDLLVTGGKITADCQVKSYMDHRIAMSFLILGLTTKNSILVDDCHMINTSFPNFFDLMSNLGVKVTNGTL